MGLRINTNTLSLNAQRNLSRSSKALQKSLERLSSGLRINRAGDDAAGLAIASGLEAQTRAIARGIQNLNNAKGILETAEGAMAEQTNIIQRMRELSLQAANGAIGERERAFLNEEFRELLDEYLRINEQSDFNGTSLLSGNLNLNLQIGGGKDDVLGLSINPVAASEFLREDVFEGDFAETSGIPLAGSTIRGLRLGDVDNDGDLDVVAGAATGGGFITTLLNDGQGNFTQSQSIAVDQIDALALGDFNGDGNLDVFARDHILLGNGDGTFSDQGGILSGYPLPSAVPTGVPIGDFNNDGILDLVGSGGGAIAIWLGNGDGTFSLDQTFDRIDNPYELNVSDINNDGYDDISYGGQGTLQKFIAMNDGTGTLSITQTYDSSGGRGSALFDNDGDGNLDLILGGGWRAGNGDGTFGAYEAWSFNGAGGAPRFGDIDGDGDLDVYLDKDNPEIYLRTGVNSFEFYQALTGDFDTSQNPARIGDINGDGFGDVVKLGPNNSTFTSFASELISVSIVGTANILTQESAQDMLEKLDTGLNLLTEARAAVGAQLNRLDFVEASASITRESLSQAQSQILDADYALETASLARNQILQQAGISVLAQANLSNQLALQLVRNIGGL